VHAHHNAATDKEFMECNCQRMLAVRLRERVLRVLQYRAQGGD
jgi:hypothetical protein